MMKEQEEYFDLSTYPKDHRMHSSKNAKILGKFKDELGGLILTEYIGLRAKCYSLMMMEEQSRKMREKQTAKGTKKSVKERYLRHEHFREVLSELTTVYVKQNTMRSIKHRIGNYTQKRVSLTGFDTKRYLLDCGIKSLPYGHYRCHKN